ncbi:hypothetical protein A7P53_06385 [Acinetobacter defluvii]|uniref:hypothetical protein n=1 Tax=Acinetobacter defluvii TaxID=1871111 RepID=UPI00148F480C|nr:hypothetical protein [Acinetobacter defluvii]NNP72091.1 hypothetical protein [Acinetobacter defluvii]
MSSTLIQPKLGNLVSARLPSDWNEAIDSISANRSDWIREAIKQRLIAENLIDLTESQFLHESESIPTYTLNTSYTPKNTGVFKSLLNFLTKSEAQKKPEFAAQAFSAHQSLGSMK